MHVNSVAKDNVTPSALESSPRIGELPPPLRAAEIRRRLDDFVIGQIEAKERLSLLISMHQAWDRRSQSMHPPPNGVIIGPTGCGKTFSIQVASSYLRIPFLTVDSTSLVPSGAINGNTIETIQQQLENLVGDYSAAETPAETDRVRRAPKSIIFFDEFDKLAIGDDDGSNKRWKTDIQRTLLKFVERQNVTPELDDTNTVLVLAGGAFVGIDGPENLRKRRPEVIQLLRSAPKNTVVSDDLVNFGFMPELIARLPAIIQYDTLPESALLEILQHPKTSPLLVWTQHFERIGKELRFSAGFLDAVARRAAALQMGARALQQIVFPALARRAYAFESSLDTTIEITEAILEYRDAK